MNRVSWWVRGATRWAVVIGGSCVLPLAACNGEIGRQFRTAAGASLETGVQAIVSGLLDGVFAVIEPEPET